MPVHHNLLTGKEINRTLPLSDKTPDVDRAWTRENYLTAMRRLLHAATHGYSSTPSGDLLAAASVLIKAAELAPTADTGPDPTPTPPANPNTSDEAMTPQPKFCERGDRVRFLARSEASNSVATAPPGAAGTVVDVARGVNGDGSDRIYVRWDDARFGLGAYRRAELEVLAPRTHTGDDSTTSGLRR